MQKDSLTEFEVVLAVARRQGFRPAATELEMSTSAVSNAVAETCEATRIIGPGSGRA